MILNVKLDTQNLHSFNDLVEIRETDNNRSQDYKMSLSNFIQLLSSAGEADKTESPFLPKNCIKYVQSVMGFRVYCSIPKSQWMINYNGNHFKVGFPKMVFEYEIFNNQQIAKEQKKYRVKLSRIVAIENKGTITGDTPVYKFPYSHVDKLQGSVCMGGNQLRDIDCLTELETFHSYFLLSPFSEDYGAKVNPTTPLAVLFSDTFNEKDFNDSYLVPAERTLNEFFLLGKY
ncbi:hypothetical protein [Rossellomorea arthrocnemi]|uniref:hypothetical protein n=1 Tax=Rossellomorea arthrocnemi TaxID=2769542 RepID=UPI0019184D97|nr:hypothetical protein [Rossellomorea arthrocnemi]